MEEDKRRRWAEENVRSWLACHCCKRLSLPCSSYISIKAGHPPPGLTPVFHRNHNTQHASSCPCHPLQVRRRTDYIPLAFNLLTALAQKQQLQPLVDRAVEAHKAKREQKQQQAAAGGL